MTDVEKRAVGTFMTDVERLYESIDSVVFFVNKMDYLAARGVTPLIEKQLKELKSVLKELEAIGLGEYTDADATGKDGAGRSGKSSPARKG